MPAPSSKRARYPGAVLVDLDEVIAERDRRGRIVSARRAGEILGVAETTVVYYCRRGHLPFGRRGRLYEIQLHELEHFIDRHAAGEVCARPALLPQPPTDLTCDHCGKPLTPDAGNWRRGYGRFCNTAHYAAELRRRCRDGELDLPLMFATTKAKRRWGGRRGGQKGGAPEKVLPKQTVAEILRLRALRDARGRHLWGRPAIAKRLEITEAAVRKVIESTHHEQLRAAA